MTTEQPTTRRFHLREWRKFKRVKAVDLAAALGIERESYYRLEKKWWTISVKEIDVLAERIGINPGQFWHRPDPDRASADALLRDQPQEIVDLALKLIAAITAAPRLERHADEDWLTKFFGGRSTHEVERMKTMLEAAFPPKSKG